MRDLVVAMTGASGAVYAVRLLEVLLASGRTVHLTISPSAATVLATELGLKVNLGKFDPVQLFPVSSGMRTGAIQYHHCDDFMAGIASGSFLTGGMVICPCSMGTLASIAGGHSGNLIQRAADVHLKERRKLVLVPRETPLSSIQLGNMQRLSEAGATILPAMPGFYHVPRTIQDLVDFVVGRICDHLGVEHALFQRWGASEQSAPPSPPAAAGGSGAAL